MVFFAESYTFARDWNPFSNERDTTFEEGVKSAYAKIRVRQLLLQNKSGGEYFSRLTLGEFDGSERWNRSTCSTDQGARWADAIIFCRPVGFH